MENDPVDYLSRLHCAPFSIVRRLLADLLLFVLVVGIGLLMTSVAA